MSDDSFVGRDKILSNGSHCDDRVEPTSMEVDEQPANFDNEANQKTFPVFNHLARRVPYNTKNIYGSVSSFDDSIYDLRRFSRNPALQKRLYETTMMGEWYARDYTDMGSIHRVAAVNLEEVGEIEKLFKDYANFDRDLAILKTVEHVGDPRLCASNFPDFTPDELASRFDFIISNVTVLNVLSRHYSMMPPARKIEFLSQIPIDLADTNIIMNADLPVAPTFKDMCELQDKLSQPYEMPFLVHMYETLQKAHTLPKVRREMLLKNISKGKTWLVDEPRFEILRYVTSASINHTDKALKKFYKYLKLDDIYLSEQSSFLSSLYTVYFQDQEIAVSQRRVFFFFNGDALVCRTTMLTKTENTVCLIAFSIEVSSTSIYRVTNLSHIPLVIDSQVVETNMRATIKVSNLINMYYIDTMDERASLFQIAIMPRDNAVPTGPVTVATEKFSKPAIADDVEPAIAAKQKTKKIKKKNESRSRSQSPKSAQRSDSSVVPSETSHLTVMMDRPSPTFAEPSPPVTPSQTPYSIPMVTLSSDSPSPMKKPIGVGDEFCALVENHIDRIIRPVNHSFLIPPDNFTSSTPLPEFVTNEINKYLVDVNYNFNDMDARWKSRIDPLLANRAQIKEDTSSVLESMQNSSAHHFVLSSDDTDDDFEGISHETSTTRRLQGLKPIYIASNTCPINFDTNGSSESESKLTDPTPFIFHPRKLQGGDNLDKIISNLDWYKDKDASFTGFEYDHNSEDVSKQPKKSESYPINDVNFMDIEKDGKVQFALVPLTQTSVEQSPYEDDGSYTLCLPEGGSIVAEGNSLYLIGKDEEGVYKSRFCAGSKQPSSASESDETEVNELPDNDVEAGDIVKLDDKYYFFDGQEYGLVTKVEADALLRGEAVMEINNIQESKDDVFQKSPSPGVLPKVEASTCFQYPIDFAAQLAARYGMSSVSPPLNYSSDSVACKTTTDNANQLILSDDVVSEPCQIPQIGSVSLTVPVITTRNNLQFSDTSPIIDEMLLQPTQASSTFEDT